MIKSFVAVCIAWLLLIATSLPQSPQDDDEYLKRKKRTSIVVGGTWTLVNDTTSSTTTANVTCSPDCTSVTIPSTTSGNLLLAIAYANANADLSAGPSVGATWVAPANCNSFQASTGAVSCIYAINVNGGVTSLAMTLGANANIALEVREYHWSGSTITAETVPAGTTSASCSNNCTAATVTLSGTQDIVFSGIATGNDACSASSPFGNFTTPSLDGAADHLNTNSGTGATFAQGTACPTAAAAAASMISIAFRGT